MTSLHIGSDFLLSHPIICDTCASFYNVVGKLDLYEMLTIVFHLSAVTKYNSDCVYFKEITYFAVI